MFPQELRRIVEWIGPIFVAGSFRHIFWPFESSLALAHWGVKSGLIILLLSEKQMFLKQE